MWLHGVYCCECSTKRQCNSGARTDVLFHVYMFQMYFPSQVMGGTNVIVTGNFLVFQEKGSMVCGAEVCTQVLFMPLWSFLKPSTSFLPSCIIMFSDLIYILSDHATDPSQSGMFPTMLSCYFHAHLEVTPLSSTAPRFTQPDSGTLYKPNFYFH